MTLLLSQIMLSTSRSWASIFRTGVPAGAAFRPLPAWRGFASQSQQPTSRASLARYSPWSNDFSGSFRMRILLQSTFCVVCIVGLTGTIHSYIVVRTVTLTVLQHRLNAEFQAKSYFSRASW